MAQRFRQGCVFSLLLYNVLFAAILLVALKRFSEGTDKLADISHVKSSRRKLALKRCIGMCAVFYLGDIA